MNTKEMGLAVVAVCGGMMLAQGCRTAKPPLGAPPAAQLPQEQPVTPELLTNAPEEMLALPPLPGTEAPSHMTYTVKKGDSLSKIAAMYGVSLTDLKDLNKLSDPNKLKIGEELQLPDYAKKRAVAAPKKTAAAPKKSTSAKAKKAQSFPPGANVYTIQKGDSLAKIAVKHGTTTAALKKLNNLSSDRIIAGEKLMLPSASAAASVAAPSASAPAPAEMPAAPAPAAEVAPSPAAPSPAPSPAADPLALPPLPSAQ